MKTKDIIIFTLIITCFNRLNGQELNQVIPKKAHIYNGIEATQLSVDQLMIVFDQILLVGELENFVFKHNLQLIKQLDEKTFCFKLNNNNETAPVKSQKIAMSEEVLWYTPL